MPEDQLLSALESDPAHCFSHWPEPLVARVAAGVYTIWEQNCFIYVGISGRAMTSDAESSDRPPKAKGL